MITFLPYEDFDSSARVLDSKRLNKQLLECVVILKIVTNPDNLPEDWDKSIKGYRNHPAIKMWEGYDYALMAYFNSILSECKRRGIKSELNYIQLKDHLIIQELIPGSDIPWWLGNKEFHRSHRSRLISKNPEFYASKFPKEDKGYNGSQYWYPDNKYYNFWRMPDRVWIGPIPKYLVSPDDIKENVTYRAQIEGSHKSFRVQLVDRPDPAQLLFKRISTGEEYLVDRRYNELFYSDFGESHLFFVGIDKAFIKK